MKDQDVIRVARAAVTLGYELEDKAPRVMSSLGGWQEGPSPCSGAAGDDVCRCGHSAVSHDNGTGICLTTDIVLDGSSAPCPCVKHRPLPNTQGEDSAGERAQAARAAEHRSEFEADIRTLASLLVKVSRRMDMACPPTMEALRNRLTGGFDPETATDALVAGWCPNCWQVDQAHVPLTTAPSSGLRYYSDRCRPCGDFRKEYDIDKPREIVAGHLASPPKRFSPEEVDQIVAREKAMQKKTRRKGKAA